MYKQNLWDDEINSKTNSGSVACNNNPDGMQNGVYNIHTNVHQYNSGLGKTSSDVFAISYSELTRHHSPMSHQIVMRMLHILAYLALTHNIFRHIEQLKISVHFVGPFNHMTIEKNYRFLELKLISLFFLKFVCQLSSFYYLFRKLYVIPEFKISNRSDNK